ncbi:phosphoribosylaminoimidazolesuccinocarboxamide synthase [Kitasatospora sp. NPDC050463]|uniref:phosphoribosylaminoimidazolesuccinocarboxamide synthase n=1 Tax=Kitasatospora sp. NPDC050463 TaxID=3155786 RepID=UPI0033EDDBA1
MPVLHSTKRTTVLRAPTADREGIGEFEYTDRYSVFHYGPMPDAIPGKSEAACRMAVFNFQLLEAAGVPTHFLRQSAPNRIQFTLARLPETLDHPLTPERGNYLLPLQVLFRNELPPGNSVHRRLASGDLRPVDLGLDAVPAVGERPPRPTIEYATTREPVNRFLTPADAQLLSGLDDRLFGALSETTTAVNTVLSDHAAAVGINHCDGKTEFLVTGNQDLLLDSPGTPDESRLMFDGVHCGKQILRDWYVRSGNEVPVGQLLADGVPRHQWPRPAPLPPAFVSVMSDLYRALCERWTGERHWNAPDLATATRAVRALTEE